MNESDELKECVKEFFEQYLNRREEFDNGRMFAPITVRCCRATLDEPLYTLLKRMEVLSGAAKVKNEQ